MPGLPQGSRHAGQGCAAPCPGPSRRPHWRRQSEAGGGGRAPGVPSPPSPRYAPLPTDGAGRVALRVGTFHPLSPQLALLQLNPNSNEADFSSVLPTIATLKQKSLSVGKCGIEHGDERKSPLTPVHGFELAPGRGRPTPGQRWHFISTCSGQTFCLFLRILNITGF